MWLVRCSCCGQKKVMRGYMLLSGKSSSCGCLRSENAAKSNTKHGHASRKRGMSPEYRAWRQMLRRCYDEAYGGYKNYGGRGITVCDRWRFGENGKTAFECFLADLGLKPSPKHEMDRIDPNGDYELSNCRWEFRGKGLTRWSVLITIGSRTQVRRHWEREFGWPKGKLCRRINSISGLLRRCSAKVAAQTFTRDPRTETTGFPTLRSFRNAGGIAPFDTTKLEPHLTREERREYFKAVWAGQDTRWRTPHPAVTQAVKAAA
jgi:hypothetical protein